MESLKTYRLTTSMRSHTPNRFVSIPHVVNSHPRGFLPSSRTFKESQSWFYGSHSTLNLCCLAFRVSERSFEDGKRSAVITTATSSTGTVRIIIKGKKLEITDAIRDYAEKKVSQAISHYASTIKEADVTLSVRGGDTGTKGVKEQKTEVTVYTERNGVIRSEETADILYASIDLVCDKLERKLQKVKEKAIATGKWPGSGGAKGGIKLNEMEGTVIDSLDSDDENDYDWIPQIVRTKYLHLEPMTAVEAANTLEDLEHDFFLFLDDETKKIQVIYKRKEQGYGLLIPLE